MVRSSGFGSTSCNSFALFRLAFASAPILNILTSLHNVTRRPVLQKVRHHTVLPRSALSACKHRVSGSLSLPSRGPFHLSLTVLYAIGHQVVFSLRRWSSHIHTGFHVSCATLDTRQLKSISSTRLLLCFVQLSRSVQLLICCIMQVRTPSEQAPQVWAHSLSLTTTYEIVDLLSFPPGTKMFQFPGFPSPTLYIHVGIPPNYER